MAVSLPYPQPDPATGEWDPFALLRNLQFLAQRLDSATSINQTTIPFRSAGAPIVDVVSTAAETTVLSTTIGAGVLGTDRTLRITVQGDVLNDTGADRTFTLRIKYGGTTFLTLSGGTLTDNATRRGWQMQGFLTAAGSATAQFSWGLLQPNSAGVTGGLYANSEGTRSAHNAGAINSATAQTLLVTIQPSTSSSVLSIRPFVIVGELV